MQVERLVDGAAAEWKGGRRRRSGLHELRCELPALGLTMEKFSIVVTPIHRVYENRELS